MWQSAWRAAGEADAAPADAYDGTDAELNELLAEGDATAAEVAALEARTAAQPRAPLPGGAARPGLFEDSDSDNDTSGGGGLFGTRSKGAAVCAEDMVRPATTKSNWEAFSGLQRVLFPPPMGGAQGADDIVAYLAKNSLAASNEDDDDDLFG